MTETALRGLFLVFYIFEPNFNTGRIVLVKLQKVLNPNKL